MLNFAFENNLKVFLEVFQSDEMFPFETFVKQKSSIYCQRYNNIRNRQRKNEIKKTTGIFEFLKLSKLSVLNLCQYQNISTLPLKRFGEYLVNIILAIMEMLKYYVSFLITIRITDAYIDLVVVFLLFIFRIYINIYVLNIRYHGR